MFMSADKPAHRQASPNPPPNNPHDEEENAQAAERHRTACLVRKVAPLSLADDMPWVKSGRVGA